MLGDYSRLGFLWRLVIIAALGVCGSGFKAGVLGMLAQRFVCADSSQSVLCESRGQRRNFERKKGHKE